MPDSLLLTPKDVIDFRENGMLLLRAFYDCEHEIRPIQLEIYRIIGQIMMRHGLVDNRKPCTACDFDDGYAALIAYDRTLGSEVYDAVKQIPALVRLVSSVNNERIFRELRPNSIPGLAAGGYGIRIDNPKEERFRASWHQEYPAQLRSLDGVVFWTPLVPVSREMGPVVVCPGSHQEGVIQVHTRDPRNPEKVGAYALTLKNESALVAKFAQTAPLLVPGDLLLLDFLTLHSSGENTGSRSRWSIQFRYFNFNDATGRRHGWKGSYAAGIDFRTIHPELCAD